MTKRQLIDQILTINRTAEPAFLARFPDAELDAYLQHLRRLVEPRLTGDARRYEKYFPAGSQPAGTDVALADGPAVSTEADAAERAALLADQPPQDTAQEPAATAGAAQREDGLAPQDVAASQPAEDAPAAEDEPVAEQEPASAGEEPSSAEAPSRHARPWRPMHPDEADGLAATQLPDRAPAAQADPPAANRGPLFEQPREMELAAAPTPASADRQEPQEPPTWMF